ncbi:MAG: hypothetical protein WCX59_02585 [Anaerovoracaceae bacterium]
MEDKKQRKITAGWWVRIIGILVFGVSLAFYMGYGRPLPFQNPQYGIWDNIWLMVIPMVLAGLLIGAFLPRVGGYIVAVPITLAMLMQFVTEEEMPYPMLIPLGVGMAYLFVGYRRKNKINARKHNEEQG